MCGCGTHHQESSKVAELDRNALTLRVEDMTCGHCAASVAKAVEAGIPGAVVHVDAAAKVVRVSGTIDVAAVRALISRAGYTPVEPGSV